MKQQLINAEMSEWESLNRMFGSPLKTSHKQFVRLKRYYNIPDNDNNEPIQNYQVDDSTLVQDIIKKWFYKNIKQDQNINDHKPKDYVLMWGTQFPLYEHYTIRDIKTKLQVQRLPLNCIRVYLQLECPYHQNQAATNYNKFQLNHSKQVIQRTVKIQNIGKNRKQNYYFYLKLNFNANFNDLFNIIAEYLNDINNCIVYNKTKQVYKVCLKKDGLNAQQIQNLRQALKGYQFDEDYSKIYIPKSKLNVRQIFTTPAYIINLQFQNNSQIIIKQQKKYQQFNPQVHILCYQQHTTKLSIQQPSILSYASKDVKIQSKIIKKDYQQIRNIKINTILTEQKIKQPLVTSLYYEKSDKVLKPFEFFSQLDNCIQSQLQEPIVLICVPQNFLYYRQLHTMQNKGYKKTMNDVLNQLINQKKLNQISRSVYINKRQNNIQSQKIQEQFKHDHILDPLLLYTGPHLYHELNQFLRETSVSLFDSKNLATNSWQYSLCQKLIKSLLRFNNFQGKVFRGSLDYDYNYEEGQIIQWNCFNSTSTQKQWAFSFINRSPCPCDPYFFEIQTYSGKNISKFSYRTKQCQVLIMPYTRFLVKQVHKNYLYTFQQNRPPIQLTYIILQQLPIPKKIPGQIVVWIDNNSQQNYKTFIKIVKKNKLKNFDIVQIISNEYFKQWLNQYKQILSLPGTNVHFITNMNRPPEYCQQGIQTLRIIRKFRPNSMVIYYISNIQITRNYLNQTQFSQDQNIQIVNKFKSLQNIFLEKLVNKQQ